MGPRITHTELLPDTEMTLPTSIRALGSRLALAACLLAAAVAAAEPVARIVGPTENTPGNLVVLRTDGTVGTGHTWKIIPPEAEQFFLPILDSSGAQAAVFSTNKGGTFTFILTVSENGVVDWEAKTLGPSQTAIAVHTLVQGAKPPPDPDPPDPPPPGPVGFRVLILEETTARNDLIPSEAEVLVSPVIRTYLSTKTAKGPDGKTPEYRIWDDDLTEEQLANVSEIWRAAYRDAKTRSAGRLPWLHASNGTAGISAELPDTVDLTLALLKKYGG